MPKFSRAEIEETFAKYCAVSANTDLTTAETGKPWTDSWIEFYTDDAIYIEHSHGVFRGKQTIHKWISAAMSSDRGKDWIHFPAVWHMIDEEKGRVVAYFQNRLRDLGDGAVYEEPNISIMHYAGNGRWSYQEDIYNPAHMDIVMRRWQSAKDQSSSLSDAETAHVEARAKAHADADARDGFATV